MLSVFMVASAGAILTSAMPVATDSRTKANYVNKAANFAAKEIELMKAQTYPDLIMPQTGNVFWSQNLFMNFYN